VYLPTYGYLTNKLKQGTPGLLICGNESQQQKRMGPNRHLQLIWSSIYHCPFNFCCGINFMRTT